VEPCDQLPLFPHHHHTGHPGGGDQRRGPVRRHHRELLRPGRTPRSIALWRTGRGDEARPLLLAAAQALPATLPADFNGQRLRAETLLWAARGWLPADAALALGWARQAQELVQDGPVPDANATRRWLPALSLGEQAAALQQLGRKAQATAGAGLAPVQWQAQPPARFAAYVARERLAAAQP